MFFVYFIQLNDDVRENADGGQTLFFISSCIQKCVFKKLMNVTSLYSAELCCWLLFIQYYGAMRCYYEHQD